MSLQLRDFRTYDRAEVSLGDGLTVVYGPNGAGKSNLLEAIYFGCTGHGLRARNDRELVRFGAQATRVVVKLRDQHEPHELTVGYGALPGDEKPVKRMTADGAHVERLLDLEQRPLISVFLPDRLELLKGAPALRRAHLDQLVAAIWPLRGETRRGYSRALAQRNALLASIRAGRASSSTLPSWDRELAHFAVALRADRTAAVALISEGYTRLARELGLAGEALLEYRPRSEAESVEEFVAELKERLARELERGFGTHGPHRDELAIRRDGRDLRVYGSQGEQRLALLALLLAEREALGRTRGRTPLMLLDDVMSELDSARRELLARELANGGQSVIATTDLAQVPGATDRHVMRLSVSPGVIEQELATA